MLSDVRFSGDDYFPTSPYHRASFDKSADNWKVNTEVAVRSIWIEKYSHPDAYEAIRNNKDWYTLELDTSQSGVSLVNGTVSPTPFDKVSYPGKQTTFINHEIHKLLGFSTLADIPKT